MKSLNKIFIGLGAFTLLSPLTSCVNEWPHPEELAYDVTLIVHCDTEWLPQYNMDYTRAEDEYNIIYQFEIYNAGQTTNPVKVFSLYSYDFTRADFTVDLKLDPGSYDVYVWSDYCNAFSGESLFYDSSNFAAITYLTPYKANSNYKDAFRGMVNFTIEDSMDLHPAAQETVVLSRPLSRYVFVATDLEDFVDHEISRGKLRGVATREDRESLSTRELEEELVGYTIKVVYPLYMPAVYDVFSNKPYDSWTDVSFNGSIVPLSESEASLGLDYVMIGLDPSSVQVALEIYDDEGERIGGTNVINVPIVRNRTTYIYGDFLTSQEDAGVSINPDFDGQYNIEYR